MRHTDSAVAIIPARYASTRFPGKPLVDIGGTPMVIRVAERVSRSRRIHELLVATDDSRIAAVVGRAGFRSVMTSNLCASGTDRVAEAIEISGTRDATLIVNVQGDEPLVDPTDIDALVEETFAKEAQMGTLARPLEDPTRFSDPNTVKVVAAADGRALYFSRAPVPWGDGVPPLLHIGLYAYRPDVLAVLARTPPSRLERSERLEQLRALELGIPIHVAFARSRAESIAVDRPEDVAKVLAALRPGDA